MIDVSDYDRPVKLLVSSPVTDPETGQVSYAFTEGRRLDANIQEVGASKQADGNAERGNADVIIRLRGEMHAVKVTDMVRDHDGQEYSIGGVNKDRANRETILTCTRVDAETDPGD
ncbi:phage head completion protein [Zavarzinella formosa]|uniref:phage head completion protein n=1 Tax=Zavarzinella formosa TaxID=360055 RepID=UPI000363491F|nr:head-tail adaptor protein [Zavarzinella formosa]